MKPGVLTACLDKDSLETAISKVKAANATYIEIAIRPGSHGIDLLTITEEEILRAKEQIGRAGLTVSSLAYYEGEWVYGQNLEKSQTFVKAMIDFAAKLECSTVCMLAGFPVDGKTKIETIKEVLPGVFRPILDYADEKGVVVALENWFATCLQGMDTFECLFETISDENLGLNYDPSHLYHQEIDYIEPVRQFRDKIFHTHAKDCLVDNIKKHHNGVLSTGWWRYVIPGFGGINWGEYLSALREIGYDGTLSIEHEDAFQTPEEGITRGIAYLEQFC